LCGIYFNNKSNLNEKYVNQHTIQQTETIQKTYKTYAGSEGLETVKLYEDNTITVTFNTGAIEHLKNCKLDSAYYEDEENVLNNTILQDNVEYLISNINENIERIYVNDSHIPKILILTKGRDLYYVKTIQALLTGKFETVKLVDDVVADVKFDAHGSAVILGTNKGNLEEYVIRGSEEDIGLAAWDILESPQWTDYIENYKGTAY